MEQGRRYTSLGVYQGHFGSQIPSHGTAQPAVRAPAVPGRDADLLLDELEAQALSAPGDVVSPAVDLTNLVDPLADSPEVPPGGPSPEISGLSESEPAEQPSTPPQPARNSEASRSEPGPKRRRKPPNQVEKLVSGLSSLTKQITSSGEEMKRATFDAVQNVIKVTGSKMDRAEQKLDSLLSLFADTVKEWRASRPAGRGGSPEE